MEDEICDICEAPIETVDGITSCQCEDSGYDGRFNYNFCYRCHEKAVDCGCEGGFAYDERD